MEMDMTMGIEKESTIVEKLTSKIKDMDYKKVGIAVVGVSAVSAIGIGFGYKKYKKNKAKKSALENLSKYEDLIAKNVAESSCSELEIDDIGDDLKKEARKRTFSSFESIGIETSKDFTSIENIHLLTVYVERYEAELENIVDGIMAVDSITPANVETAEDIEVETAEDVEVEISEDIEVEKQGSSHKNNSNHKKHKNK